MSNDSVPRTRKSILSLIAVILRAVLFWFRPSSNPKDNIIAFSSLSLYLPSFESTWCLLLTISKSLKIVVVLSRRNSQKTKPGLLWCDQKTYFSKPLEYAEDQNIISIKEISGDWKKKRYTYFLGVFEGSPSSPTLQGSSYATSATTIRKQS